MKMKIVLTLLVAVTVAVAAVPASAASETPTPTTTDRENAAEFCRAQRATMNAAVPRSFENLYGTNRNKSNAFGKCVSQRARAEQENRSDAAQECEAERANPNFAATHGGKTFEQFYGTNANGRNAFGKCVSTKARAESEAEQQATLNAAKTCKALRRDQPTVFAQRYGTRPNAFGKCVSSVAKAQND